MGKSVTPPPSPNFQQSAIDQTAANKEAALWSAQASNPNVVNPLYAQTVKWQDNIPTVTQGFNPNTQAGRQAAEAQAYQYTANNLLNQLAANRTAALGQILNQPFSLQGYGKQQQPGPGTNWINKPQPGFQYGQPGSPSNPNVYVNPNPLTSRPNPTNMPGFQPGVNPNYALPPAGSVLGSPVLPNYQAAPSYAQPNFGSQGTSDYRRR